MEVWLPSTASLGSDVTNHFWQNADWTQRFIGMTVNGLVGVLLIAHSGLVIGEGTPDPKHRGCPHGQQAQSAQT